jgi:hypothetical protein
LKSDLKKAGLVIKTEPYRTTIPRSQRGGEIVEPMISTQWFVTIEPLAKAALEAVRDGRVRIVPERFDGIGRHLVEMSPLTGEADPEQHGPGHAPGDELALKADLRHGASYSEAFDFMERSQSRPPSKTLVR